MAKPVPQTVITAVIQLINFKISQMNPTAKRFPLCSIKTLQCVLCSAHDGYRTLFTEYNKLFYSLAKYAEM